MGNGDTLHCDMPDKMPRELLPPASFHEKQEALARLLDIKGKEKDIRYGGVCNETQQRIEQVILQDYARNALPGVLLKLEQYLPGSYIHSKYTLDTFYNTIKIQKEYNAILENNTHLVYEYYQANPSVKQLDPIKIDGIAGPQCGNILNFLIFVKGKRERILKQNSQNAETILQSKDLSELSQMITDKIIVSFARQLSGKEEKIDISLDALYTQLKEVYIELNSMRYTSKNPFLGEILIFFENFFGVKGLSGEEEKGKKILKILLIEIIGIPQSDTQRVTSRVELFSSVVGFTIDVAKINTDRGLIDKMEELKRIPAFGKILTRFAESNNEPQTQLEENLSKILKILPKLASGIHKGEIIQFFENNLKNDLVYLLNNLEKKDSAEFKTIQDRCIIHFSEFVRTKILPGIESINPDKRKEILDEIFSISYFKDLRSSEHVKIITELVGESEASYIKVTSELLVLFEKFIETGKVTDQDFKNFQDQAFAGLRELPREKRDNLIGYLQKTRSEIPSFLLGFLKSGTFEFTEDISQVAFKFFASKSLKDNLEKGFLLSLEKVRATLLAGSQEIKRDSSSRWPTGDVMKDLGESLRRLFIDKLSRSLGDEGINQSFTKKEIEDQFFTFSKAYFTDLKIPVEDETLRYIVHGVLTNLIAQLGKKDIPSSYILDLGLIGSPNEKSLALIDFTVNELYLLKDAPGGEKRLEALLIYGVQAKGYKEFLSTSILEKTLIQNFLLLIRFISKSDFKMVLFENKELFEKLLSGAEFSKEEMSQEAMKLLFKLIQKANITQQAPIKAGGTSFENFILFIKKTGVPPEDVSSVFSGGKATFEVLKGKQKFRSKKELFDTHGNEIMKFSKSLFTILSKYVKYYGKPGVQLLIDEKILRTSQGGKGSKAYLMEGLSQVFTYQNIFDTFGRFIQAGFDKKAAQDQFIIDYFSKPSNINHFQEAIFNLVYDKVREPKIVELQIP